MNAEPYLDAVLSIWSERRERTSSKLSGDSMAPLLRQGDVLLIEHGSESIRVGDILVFRGPDRLLAHRLVCRRGVGRGEVLLAKGDRCRAFDPPIMRDEIIGKIVEVTGSSGHLRLTSRFWMVANYCLAALSRVEARNATVGSAGWCVVRMVRRLLLMTLGERPVTALAQTQGAARDVEKHTVSIPLDGGVIDGNRETAAEEVGVASQAG
jgi:signal peptidase I